jgi:hypothetical protein
MTRASTCLGIGYHLLLVALAAATPASAEIYQCDGKWTNKPCGGTIERTMHEKVDPQAALPGLEEMVAEQSPPQNVVPEAPNSEPLAPRYSLARKLKKLNKDFTEDHGVSLTKEEVRAFEERCTRRETPFSQCQSEYDVFAQRLNALAQAKKQQ